MTQMPERGLAKMYDLIATLPAQMTASADLEGLSTLSRAGAVGRLIMCGMGGSAIAGDLIQPMLQGGRTGLSVWRDYDLPHWATADDFVVCCSYSGNTEETLSAARAAGARQCRRMAITSGGQLAQLAAAEKFPIVLLPPGLPPRASLGYGLGALVRSLGRLGFVAAAAAELDRAVAVLRSTNDLRLLGTAESAVAAADSEGNISPAGLAEILAGRIPVIYTGGLEAHAVGLRWKAQLNENSKTPAMVVPFPELNHNDIVGWCLSAAQRERFVLIMLRGAEDNERMKSRIAITRDLLANEFAAVHEVHSVAGTALGRVMSLVQYGDYLSCHLARVNGVDPIPVTRITKLKNALG